MDPHTSYVFHPGYYQETADVTHVSADTLTGVTEDNSPRFVPDSSFWQTGYPSIVSDTNGEQPLKRRRIQPSPLSSHSREAVYSQEAEQPGTYIPTVSCPVHAHDASLLLQRSVTNQVSVELQMFPLPRRMRELGQLVCPCSPIYFQETDGYERLAVEEQHYNPSQQDVAEKKTLVNSTNCRAFSTQDLIGTGPGRSSNLNGTTPYEYNAGQAYGPQPCMNSSMLSPDSYRFNSEPPNAVIAISAITIARPHTQLTYDARLGPRPGKRRPFTDPSLRQETAHTRRIGCCIRCRMQRIRCDKNPEDPDGTCLTCKRLSFPRTGQLPCLRYKIVDIILYKSGQVPGLEWTSRWSNEISDPIDTWASSEIRTIHISEGYSDHVMELRVRRFVPIKGDKMKRTWHYNGQKISVSIPPFALIDLDEARKSFARHIDANIQDALRRVTGTSARMMRATYLQAWHLGQRLGVDPEVSSIIQATMRLWTSTRLNTTSTFIVGSDTLGMLSDILNETSPTPGKIPLPPVLGAQLNLVMIHQIQTRLRKTVLDQLQRIVQKNKHSTWLVTYFVDFILLHNASMIISHDSGYARKHGINRRFAREDKVKEYHAGANIVLAYFHYCNKGLYPFSDECSDAELRSLAQLTDRDVQFVRATGKYAMHREPEWKKLRESDRYDDPEYYISQLFEKNWAPRPMA